MINLKIVFSFGTDRKKIIKMNKYNKESLNNICNVENGDMIIIPYQKCYYTFRYKRYLRKRDTVSILPI